ncbi:hypothetical protein AAES00_26510, partial [Klebsiella pneumoniae]
GLLVVGLRIPAIVATLGTLGLYRGVMLLWTGGKWIEGLPDSLKSLSEPAFIGVSPLGWLVLALLLAGGGPLSRPPLWGGFFPPWGEPPPPRPPGGG